MRLLLDTHTFIWAATWDDRMSETAQALFLDSNNVLYLSTASIWKIAIKTSIGK